MAGDWLKFEKATLDKPEVFAIADALGIDPDAVIGKLVRVWAWFDSHTVDGNAARVTPSLLNRVSGVSGFIEAMAVEGWAVIDASGVSLPHFDRHNGETSKQRALTAKRVANYKAKGNAEVTQEPLPNALPREEKRRGKSTEPNGSAAVAAPAVKADPIWDTGLAFLIRKGIPVKPARGLLGQLRKAAGDIQCGAILADAEAQDISDPAPWLMKAAANAKARGSPNGAPVGKTMQAIQALQEMKNGLAVNRDHDGVPEAALLEFGPDSGGRGNSRGGSGLV